MKFFIPAGTPCQRYDVDWAESKKIGTTLFTEIDVTYELKDLRNGDHHLLTKTNQDDLDWFHFYLPITCRPWWYIEVWRKYITIL